MGFFFYLVCFTAVNLCAKNVLSINHSSGDKFKVLASPGTFNTLFFWDMLGFTSFIITPGQKQISKRYFAGDFFGK